MQASLPSTIELLDSTLIRAAMSKKTQALLTDLIILDQVTSTNQYLIDQNDAPSGSVCLAEQQTAGRGRRGRTWVSPFGANIYLSLLWQFPVSMAKDLACLSLVVGIAVVSTLQRYGVMSVGIKWPNDICYQQRKLAGILVEMTEKKHQYYRVVIGVGLNLSQPETTVIDQPWVDLQSIIKKPPQRNQLTGLLLDELFTVIPIFQAQGFAAFAKLWQCHDELYGKAVTVHTANESIIGFAMGVDASGQLVLNCNGVQRHFNSGEVTVRRTK